MNLKEMISKSHRLWTSLAEVHNRPVVLKSQLEETNGQFEQALEGFGRAVAASSDNEFGTRLAGPERITVTVACATSERQLVEEVQLNLGATIEDGIVASGITRGFPDLDLSRCRVGIHGSVKSLDHPVQEGDRVEIYRPVEATS